MRSKIKIAKLPSDAEMHISNVFMQVPAAIAVVEGPHQKYVLANALYQKMFNRSEKQLLGKTIREVFPEMEGQGLFELMENIYKSGESFTAHEFPAIFSHNGITKRGYYDFVAQPIKNEDRKVSSIIIHAVEVTEQIEARKEIGESVKRYNMMMQSPFAFAILKGKDLVIALANDSIKEMWGKGKDIEGKPLLEVLPEIKEQAFPALLMNVLTSGIPYYAYEMLAKLVRHGKMEDVYFNYVYQPYREADETISGVVVIAIETTKEVIAKKNFEEANARLATVVQSSQDAIIGKTTKGIVTSWNEGAHKMFGYTEKEMIGQSITKIIPDNRLEEETYILGKINCGEMIEHFETQRLTKKGKVIDISVTISPIKNSQGNIIGASKIARDITNAKQAQAIIKESEERFRRLANETPLFIWLADENLQTTYLNKEGYSYFNLNETNKLSDLSWKKFIHHKDLQKVLDRMHEAAIKHEPYTLEMRLKNGVTGEYRWFLDKGVPRYEHEKFIGFIGTSLDIHDRKKWEKEIKASEKNFRQLANLLPEKITTTDAEGNVTYYNKNWYDYTGLTFDELKDWGWKKIIHPEDEKNNINLWKEALASGHALEVEERLLSKTGEYKWHLSRVSPIKDEKGKIQKWVSATTDIHEQKMKEQSKDDFLSIASHEMKTPLTITKAYLQLLEHNLHTDNTNALLYTQKASQSVIRLHDLILELLDVNKIQSGKLDYKISAFNFNEIINDTVEDLQRSITTHKIIKTGKVKSEVTGDRERLMQVVINLINNAIKYSPDANEIFIHLQQEDGFIKVSVKDKGIGISKTDLEKIFNKYYRVKGQITSFQGLGIGLYISSEIIKRHNGKLWAESEEGKGSSFCFTLPVEVNA